MRVMAQVGMVMNLDKCIGCHTCSVTCKQAWTNRAGTEYVWFNNVETRPGQGYPPQYEDQDKWRGGWHLNAKGKLRLRTGGRLQKLLTLFASPVQPTISDYYEPWTYDYQTLIDASLGDDFPVAKPKSLLTGEDTKISWSANWDDNLGGAPEMGELDPIVAKLRRDCEDAVKFSFEQTFMFYLPRICEHCLNPSCMASCPSGAIYKRSEDGIVLVDQDRCRGWRQCITGCPYKKIYFNHKSGKAEKCTLCYPRIEVGQPTVCSETCVGRLRYLGIFLYDAEGHGTLFGAIDALRIPVEYLAEMFTAGDSDVIDTVLKRLAAMRAYMRDVTLGRDPNPEIPASVGMTEEQVYEMYRLMAIAKYEDRYVIPTAHLEQAEKLDEMGCSLDYEEGPGMFESGSFGEASGRPAPVSVETFHALKQRQTSDTAASAASLAGRVNLLNWDGNGIPNGMFPPSEKP